MSTRMGSITVVIDAVPAHRFDGENRHFQTVAARPMPELPRPFLGVAALEMRNRLSRSVLVSNFQKPTLDGQSTRLSLTLIQGCPLFGNLNADVHVLDLSLHTTRNCFRLPCSPPQGPSARPPAARRHENFHEDADTVDGWRKVFKCILKCSNTSASIAVDSKIKWSTPLLKSHPVYSQGFVGSTIQLANDGDPRDIWNG